YPHERLAFMLADARAPVLLNHAALLDRLPGNTARTVSLDADASAIALRPTTAPAVAIDLQNPAFVIYTSGSTGLPKGVTIHHAGVVNYLTWAVADHWLDTGTGAPVNTSIAFDAVIPSLLLPLLAGKAVTLLPEDRQFEILASAHDCDFSLLKLSPTHLEIL